jgi:hypothetical protein
MLGAHDGKDRSGDVHWTEQGGLDLRPEVLRADLLEEPGVEVTGVVDHHVYSAESLDGCLDGVLRIGGIGDVELDGQQVIGCADGVSRGERGPRRARARAMSVPIPRPAPVMNQILLSAMLSLPFR